MYGRIPTAGISQHVDSLILKARIKLWVFKVSMCNLEIWGWLFARVPRDMNMLMTDTKLKAIFQNINSTTIRIIFSAFIQLSWIQFFFHLINEQANTIESRVTTSNVKLLTYQHSYKYIKCILKPFNSECQGKSCVKNKIFLFSCYMPELNDT